MTDDPLDVAAGSDAPRPILLGEAPSRQGDRYHAFPLSGRPARVLCELTGIPPQPDGSTYGRWTWALYERFLCRNLHERYAAATPWSAPRARDVARELLDELKAAAHLTAGIDIARPGAAVVVTASPTVVVCLGRKVQAAVFGALDKRIVTTARRNEQAWNTGWFGDFGVWSSPWMIYTPVYRLTCTHCGADSAITSGPKRTDCPVGALGHDFKEQREQCWAPYVVTIPHPSGLNRLLNDEATRALCGDVLRRAMELAGARGSVGDP